MYKVTISEVCSPPTLASCLSASVILGVIGPFGMYETTGLIARIIYWIVMIGVATFLAVFFKQFALRYLRGLGFIGLRIGAAVGFAICFTPILYGFNAAFYLQRWDGLLPWQYMLMFLCLIYLGVGVVIEAINLQFNKPQAQPPESERPAPFLGEPEPPKEAPFLSRLDPSLGKDLIRLAMQDHYVEVHTRNGSELILMRLSDAIGELDGIEGLQVHRSHWVARGAVTGSDKDRERHYLLTVDGGRVPVSRTYRDAAKNAGLI